MKSNEMRQHQKSLVITKHMSITLSVIIPVFNVGRTLRRCVDSVLAQDVDDMEVILVDDGSTDSSPAICDDYAREGRAKVVHQKNGGLSAARNSGIAQATGRLITFVDSDDYLSPDTYRTLLPLMEDGCDIVEFSVERQTTRGIVHLNFGDRVFTDMRVYWVQGQAYAHSYACNKLYRRELFDNVRYPVGQVFEDVPALYLLLQHAKKVRTVSTGLYHYTSNPHGITLQADGKDLCSLLRSHVKILQDKIMQACKGFETYYGHVVDIQLSVYDRTNNPNDLLLPTLPYWGSVKLAMLQVLGLRGLCQLHHLYFCLTTFASRLKSTR